MGREWSWVGSKSSKKGGNEAEKDVSSATTSTTTSGCMSAVFHFFDFHHFQFPLNNHHQPPFKNNSFSPKEEEEVEPPIPKGVEAPRNSLELNETHSPSSMIKEEETLNIQMGIQIRTSGDSRAKLGSSNTDSSSSEISSSPSTKTPNLVARLMGLDLLPESPSTSFSSTPNLQSKSNLHHHFIRTRRQQQSSLQNKPTNLRNFMESDSFTGTRSLPETPRISSARRSDVDHHRLSLQINKENVVSEELEFSRFSYLRRKELRHDQDENNSNSHSPSQYARQIVKQVRESVSRKVGLDITNTINKSRERSGSEVVVSQIKSRKNNGKILTKVFDVDESSPGKYSSSTLSCSPRLRFLDAKNKTNIPISNAKEILRQPPKPSFSSSSSASHQVNKFQSSQSIKVSPKPKLATVTEQQQREDQQHKKSIKKCNKKVTNDRFGPVKLKKPTQTSDIIRNKQEEPFVRAPTGYRAHIPDKKCKKTPLSSDLLNITVPTLLPVKKDPSPPATKIPQKPVTTDNAQQPKHISSPLSSCPSQQETTQPHIARDTHHDRCNNGDTTTTTTTAATSTTEHGAATAEIHEYVTRILRSTGIDKDDPVPVSFFTNSSSLSPSVFNNIEHNANYGRLFGGQLGLRCNRELLFHLVNEVLVQILKPYLNLKPWVNLKRELIIKHIKGSDLIDMLCSKICGFPSVNCQVLEDIDALIDRDFLPLKHQSEMAFEGEGEGVAAEIEREILDRLIQETAAGFLV